MTNIVGVDPGISGAFALIDTEAWTIAITDMPIEPGVGGKNSVSAVGVARIMEASDPDYSYVEWVTASPQMGVTSAFAFGRSMGILEGASANRSILIKVRPQDWKTAMKVPKDKNQARARAMSMIPCAYELFKRVKDDGRAEAALIAFYGLFKNGLMPPRPLTLVEFPSCQ